MFLYIDFILQHSAANTETHIQTTNIVKNKSQKNKKLKYKIKAKTLQFGQLGLSNSRRQSSLTSLRICKPTYIAYAVYFHTSAADRRKIKVNHTLK